jgi:hypothetical protein
MLTLIPAQIKAAPDDYRKAAAEYRKVNPNSGEAAAFEYIANDLDERMRQAREANKTMTVAQYARTCGANVATVRKWIYRGELDASQNEKGEWEIPATARRIRRPREATPA